MRIGSLFAGIGGLDWACEQALSGRTAWQLDLTGEKVRARHFPDALQVVADVATVDPLSLPPIDVLCGGFACQDLSAAGKQASREDIHAGERTGATYRGFLRFVAALRPRFIVVENVYGLLAHRAVLERDFSGYGLTWVVCEAMDVGAPHHRRRVFVVGERGAVGRGLIEPSPLRRWAGDSWPSPCSRDHRSAGGLAHTKGGRTLADDAAQVAASVRAWPTITARAAPDCPSERNRNSPSLESMVRVRPGPTITVCGDANRAGLSPDSADGLGTAVRPWPTATARDYRVDSVEPRAREGKGETLSQSAACGRRLNPDWVETLMGFPIGWTAPEGPRLEVERAPRWPRGRYPDSWDRSVPWPGEPWEPPRTLPDGPPCPGRPARIRGLGNAVCPQQGLHAVQAALAPRQLGLFMAAK